MNYNWDWGVFFKSTGVGSEIYFDWYLTGLGWTIAIAIVAWIIALTLGSILGVMRTVPNRIVSGIATCYVELFRNVPLLVQLLISYYCLPLIGLNVPSSVAAVGTLALCTGAYIAEILRGAIQAIPPGEIEAARALGMSRAKALFYIILPRAARIGLPAYSNEVILMLKASALASTVTLLELTGMARTIIARTYLPVEIFFAAGMFYLLMAYVLVRGFKLLERWLRVDACQGR